mmetsp:Transcript_29847/g.41975  ORF Transcript_29847/g.41975 Transcript_29847/m.41975 type:complete len:377 (-) Transcript_29847:58-1188(-)
MKSQGKTVTVAAVQFNCKNRDTVYNIQRAEKFVADAHAANAQIVLFPEMAFCGYILNSEAWNYSEAENGPSTTFLIRMAAKYKIFVGCSFLEAEGHEFYNTFVLADPSGKIAGKVRKQVPSSVEAYVFKGDKTCHVIETELGRIGVLICYENFLLETLQSVHKDRPQILLAPFCAMTVPESIFYSESEREKWFSGYEAIGSRNAKLLGVPVVLTNKVGKFTSSMPGILEGGIVPEYEGDFMGKATICDSQGHIQAQGDRSSEMVVTASVTLADYQPDSPLNKELMEAKGKFWKPETLAKPFFLLGLAEAVGSWSYYLNPSRSWKAEQIVKYGAVKETKSKQVVVWKWSLFAVLAAGTAWAVKSRKLYFASLWGTQA